MRFRFVLGCACALMGALGSPAAASAADLFVTTAGSDTAACTSGAPCRSFDRAFRTAAPGAVVEVAAGSYGSQTIPADSSKTAAADVVFQPAGGATVTLGGLNVRGSHAEVRGIRTGFVDIGGSNISDVTVRGGEGTGIFIGGGTSGISIIGGSYGAGANNVAPVKVQGSPAPSNITFDGVIFHDAVRTDENAHLECIYAADIQGLTVRNSQFRNCAIMDLFITKLSGVNPRGVVIENNFFDKTGSHSNALSKGYYSLVVANHLDNATNFTIRNNSFNESMSIDAGTVSNFRVEGNVGPLSACRSGVTYGANVWQSRTCANTDKQAASGFVDAPNYDLHLAAGSAAIDWMTTGSAPAADIDGDARPKGSAPDAGADERVTGGGGGDTTPPDTTISAGPTGSSTSTSASFSFSSSETGSTFTCRLDGGAWGACSSPKAYAGLSVGDHTFQVRATDGAGNPDATPASRTWTVTTAPDTEAPDTTFTGGPAGATSQTAATFIFESSETGSTFECRLDGGQWEACSSPAALTGLALGSHTYEVRATDAAGNTDATPASSTWVVTASEIGGGGTGGEPAGTLPVTVTVPHADVPLSNDLASSVRFSRGVSLRVRHMSGKRMLRVAGRVTGARSGDVNIRVERRVRGVWRRVMVRRLHVGRNGRFSGIVRLGRSGRYRLTAHAARRMAMAPSQPKLARVRR
jgi:hypothetical protein